MLAAIRLAVPSPVKTYWERGIYHVVVPNDWAAAVKLVFIAFDTLAAMLLYLVVLGVGASERRARAAALLYYYNPMTVYVSSIYGMFDQIPLALVLAGLYLYTRNRRGWGLLLIGLAASFKPTMAVIALPVAVHALMTAGSRIGAPRLLGSLALGALAPFIPSMAADPGGLTVYLKAVSMVSSPSYASNVQYSFNGLSSIAFYAWWHGDTDVARRILSMRPLLFTPLCITLILGASRKRDPLWLAALAYIIFTATYWRVNPQYVAPLVAFTILLREVATRGRTRALSGLAIVVAGLWPLIYPISFWAWVHIEEQNPAVLSLLARVSLNVAEGLYYVYYSLALTPTLLLILAEELAPAITEFSLGKRLSKLIRKIILIIE